MKIDLFLENLKEVENTDLFKRWNQILAGEYGDDIEKIDISEPELNSFLLAFRKIALLEDEPGGIFSAARAFGSTLKKKDDRHEFVRAIHEYLPLSRFRPYSGMKLKTDGIEMTMNKAYDAFVHGDRFHRDGRQKTKFIRSIRQSSWSYSLLRWFFLFNYGSAVLNMAFRLRKMIEESRKTSVSSLVS